jgi:hypothetical protein
MEEAVKAYNPGSDDKFVRMVLLFRSNYPALDGHAYGTLLPPVDFENAKVLAE